MTPLLSEIGLPLDLIGAALLAFGLFRPSKPLYPGWQRSPWEAMPGHVLIESTAFEDLGDRTRTG
jgi:hypothetical protein